MFIKFPNSDHRNIIKIAFYDVAEFRNVIGLIDGTQIRVIVPKNVEYVFVNRKNYHSINVQPVCDNTGSFTHIVAKWSGSAHDSRTFRVDYTTTDRKHVKKCTFSD